MKKLLLLVFLLLRPPVAAAQDAAAPAPGSETAPAPGRDAPEAAPRPPLSGSPAAKAKPTGAAPAARPPPSKAPHAASISEAELRPLWPSGPLARARADYAEGRWAAAAAAFGRSRAPEARYMRAVSQVEARRGEDVVRALDGLERHLPQLADRIAFWRGRGLQIAGDARGAAAAFAGVPEWSLKWADAQLARARALADAGDRGAALDAVAPVLSLSPPEELQRGDPAADALLLTGRLRAGGDPADLSGARRAFLDCWAAHPLSGTAATCRAALGALPAPAGDPPATEDSLRHAEALLDANRNATALAELQQVVPGLPAPATDQPLACRAAFALGKAYRKERQHTKAVEVLQPVVERCDDAQLRVRALYVLASASSIVDPARAVEWYRALARDYPAHPFADDALFYAADLLARGDRTEEALAVLSELADRYPLGDFRAEALFRTAWIQRQAGSVAAALATLARVEHDYEQTDPYEYARAVYWKARILHDRGAEGDAAQAVAAWTALVERHPTDYYGLLSRARLDEVDPGAAPSWRPPRAKAERAERYEVPLVAADRHFRAGLLLHRMGLDRAAAEELAAVDRKALAEGDGLLLVAEVLDRAGDHKTSTRLVRTIGRAALRRKPEGATLRLWRVAYPAAFRREVERWAPKAGVSPDLLLALMREESGLDPAVISAAGAVGLTQLMLPTAQGVARKLRMRKPTTADLMRPELSIRLGASYFGGLLRRYGSEALALAAYNAGDVPVQRWLKARGALPLDAFVEEIPIQETRGYVKRVLRSYAAYRFLYGKPARPVLVGQALPAR